MSLSPKYAIESWGSGLWHFLHTATFAFPCQPTRKEKRAMVQFLRTLPHILPCPVCRDDFQQYVQGRIPVNSRDQISRFVVWVHNQINRKLQKPTVTFEEASRMFSPSSSACRTSAQRGRRKNLIPLLGVGVLVVLLLVVLLIGVTKSTSI